MTLLLCQLRSDTILVYRQCMDNEDRYTRITLRIPKDLHQQLAEAAEATSKSMNAEIVARLAESFSDARYRQDMTERLETLQAKINDLSVKIALLDFEYDEARRAVMEMADREETERKLSLEERMTVMNRCRDISIERSNLHLQRQQLMMTISVMTATAGPPNGLQTV